MNLPFEVTDLDRRIWHEELDEFVPAQVFDVAHAHLPLGVLHDPKKETTAVQRISSGSDLPEATWDLADACDAALMPGREVHRLAFPFPFPHACDFDGSNAFLAERDRATTRTRPG